MRTLQLLLIFISITAALTLMSYSEFSLKPEVHRLQLQEFYILGCTQAGLNKAKCKSNYKRFIQQAQDN